MKWRIRFSLLCGMLKLVFAIIGCLMGLFYFIDQNTNVFQRSVATRPNKWHTSRDMVICIDKLSNGGKSSSMSFEKKSAVHFVFVGDSRIRQHFLNFVKFIPNYDLEYQPKYNSYYKVSEDMNITSRVLNFRVSFYFRRFLGNDSTVETTVAQVFSQWTENGETDGEIRIIIAGISLHHMLDADGSANFEEFKKNLTELEPIIRRMAKGNKVVWLNQYPAIDSFGPRNSHLDVNSAKIHRYNLETKRILRKSGVILWESGNYLVEEYLRSCVLQQRADLKYFGNAYFNCLDYVHPGYSALSQAIQSVFIELCNGNESAKSTITDCLTHSFPMNKESQSAIVYAGI